ncbi:39S ribosomal protein L54, mitochondrial [Cricetulus griseus]|uniref:Large ribosomal subunit protein mL54 n=1 Tax=Cricetulus griseus TaxID=10029 RepID=G3HSK8_CRIGR|nr:39S ribosomal protein L54, mitochondrial [Cricetulus griseus]XP_027275065.1 39S ribosomal protein L54, mitochondrial [Cricetulus griseus]EGW03129.1 39S ribosomal protein L54, mitochondrial [Cricetulus griseus]
MAATRLLGASRMWAHCQLRVLPVPGGPGRPFVRDYAKKPVMKGTKGTKGSVATEALKDPEVCTDPAQLTTHAMGVNIYKEGQDVALKPDSEYPEWLFHMNLGPPKKLEELEPESPEYWRLLRKQNIWRHNRLSKNKKL